VLMSLELVPKLSWLGAEGSGLWATATSSPEPRTPSPEPTGVLGHPPSIVSQDGMTLTEVLIATTLAMVVLFGILTADVARFRMGEDIRKHSSVMSPERGNAALAVIHLAKHLERADRLDLGNTVPGLYQIRWPAGCIVGGVLQPVTCFNKQESYEWDQYQLTGNQLKFNTVTTDPLGNRTCGAWTVLSRQIAAFTLQYINGGFPPPGTPPLDVDNNMAQFALQWSDPTSGLNQTFQSQVAIRARAYTNVDTRGAPPGVNEPPMAACP